MNTTHKLFSKWDILLVTIVIIGFLSWFLFQNFAPAAGRAVVLLDGKVYKILLLNKEAFYKIYKGNEYLMTVETKPGMVRVTYAANWVFPETEKNQVSVATGWISKEGESIVNIPNRIVIYTEGMKEKTEYDVMTAQQ